MPVRFFLNHVRLEYSMILENTDRGRYFWVAEGVFQNELVCLSREINTPIHSDLFDLYLYLYQARHQYQDEQRRKNTGHAAADNGEHGCEKTSDEAGLKLAK